MKLRLSYSNRLGTVELCGSSASPFHTTAISGLGLPDCNYKTAVYTGYDGQETLAVSRLARSITIAGDITSPNMRTELSEAVDILSEPGYLYIQTENMNRRIYCNQISFPDANHILYGKISTFSMQFVCDSPFFEDARDTTVPLYKRTKELTTTFTLPTVFGRTVADADIRLKSRNRCEPIIRIVCPSSLTDATSILITNHTSGKEIRLAYTPTADEEIIIDIRNRTAQSTVNGNIINCISDDTFLSDFVLDYPSNHLSASLGDINAGIFIECIYNNRYSEALPF